VRQSLVDMTTMFSLLEMQPAIQSLPGVPQLLLTPQTATVTFEDVEFGYSSERPILNGLSFSVAAGSKLAIVGGSGSGKSTIVRLLYRFYDPLAGRVLVNGQDIRNVNLDSLRNNVGVIPQDSVLFHSDIYHNISYGKLSAPPERVYAAAQMADIHDSIVSWPQGYQTPVGERGLKLSGGEKQRISIARAFMKDPSILVYDEATSSLDSITEQKILAALDRVTQNRTTIMIAHRLSTVIDADEILVLEEGKVAERGTHAHLLANVNSLYAQLWHKQHEAALTHTTNTTTLV